MSLHRLAPPRPPPVAFTEFCIASTSKPHNIALHFYTPKGYLHRGRNQRYPVVVNFHGGGFTIGRGTDDARWAAAVTEQADAICVCVDYRLAPEHPFPVGLDDCVDAILHLVRKADDLSIDASRIAITGFSAGGNFAFASLVRLRHRLESSGRVDDMGKTLPMLEVLKGGSQAGPSGGLPKPKIVAVVAWYPSVDMSQPREVRRATNPRPDKELPRFYSKLFDASYLYGEEAVDKSNPCLSPGLATDEMLKNHMPDDIDIYTCEWDGLCLEAETFSKRLQALGKRVRYRMIPEVPHGWDKTPSPWAVHPAVDGCYREACLELKRIFGES